MFRTTERLFPSNLELEVFNLELDVFAALFETWALLGFRVSFHKAIGSRIP
ncbi:MAG: hypothetical protein RIS80_1272 [Actinomycetota bacterium]